MTISNKTNVRFWDRARAAMLAFTVTLPMAQGVHAAGEVIADPAAAARPGIAVQNTVPVISIVAPNAIGLSHNRYQEFNVPTQGLVFNNSLAAGTSALAGDLSANTNFSGRSASLILNEVTGFNSSQLLGRMEVFGSAANLVIANPNGIYSNGSGYINTPRVTLTTGVPQITSGQLTGFSVGGGLIHLDGLAMDARTVQTTDLVARNILLNAALVTNGDARLYAGQGIWRYSDGQFTNTGNTSSAAIAIDATNLGAMSAGRIFMVANEQGAGVRLDGNLSATADDIEIRANGSIALNNAHALKNVDVIGSTDVLVTGNVLAGKDVMLDATSLDVSGNVAAAERLSIKVENAFSLSGQMAAGTALNLDQKGIFTNAGLVYSEADINLQVGGLENVGGLIVGEVDVDISTFNDGLFNDGGVIFSGGALDITSSGGIVNANDGTIGAAGKASLAALGPILNELSEISSGDDLSIQTAKLLYQNGVIESGADVYFFADSFSSSGVTYAAGDLVLSVDNQIDIDAGELSSVGLLEISTEADLNNRGQISSGTGIVVDVDGLVRNEGSIDSIGQLKINGGFGLVNVGRLYADDLLFHFSGDIDNSGVIAAEAELNVAIRAREGTSTLTNAGKGVIVSNGDFSIGYENPLGLDYGLTIFNRGSMASLGDLSINAGIIDNDGANIQSNGHLSINLTGDATSDYHFGNGESLSNAGGGVISAGGDLLLSQTGAMVLDNMNGALLADGSLSIDFQDGDIWSGEGVISAKGDAAIKAYSIDADMGLVAIDGDARFDIGGTFRIMDDEYAFGGDATIFANRYDQRSDYALDVGGSFILSADDVDGLWVSAGTDIIVDSRYLTLVNSPTVAGHDVTLTAFDLRVFGDIHAGRNIELTGQDRLDIYNSDIVANNNITVFSRSMYTGGNDTRCRETCLMLAGNDIFIDATMFSSGGDIEAGRDVTILSSRFFAQDSGWMVGAGRNLNMDVGYLTNFGELLAGQDATITADDLDNGSAEATIAAEGILDIQATALNNEGTIQGGIVYISANTISNGMVAAPVLAIPGAGNASQTNAYSGSVSWKGGSGPGAPGVGAGGLIGNADSAPGGIALPDWTAPYTPGSGTGSGSGSGGSGVPALSNLTKYKYSTQLGRSEKIIAPSAGVLQSLSAASKPAVVKSKPAELEEVRYSIQPVNPSAPAVALMPKAEQAVFTPTISGTVVSIRVKDSLTNTGLIRADDLFIEGDNSLSGLGLLQAENSTSIRAANILNLSGSSVSGRDVALEAGVSLKTSNSRVSADTLLLDGGQGDLTELLGAGWSVRKDLLARTDGNISLTGTQLSLTGDLALNAGKNISLKGADLSAGGSLSLLAGNDVLMDLLMGKSSWLQGVSVEQQFSDHRTTLTAGQNVTIEAGNNLVAKAVGITAGGSVGLSAENDVTVTTVAFDRTNKWKSCTNCKNTLIETQQLGSTIQAGDDIAMSAGNDLTINGSDIKAVDDVQLLAKGDTTLASALESSEFHYRYDKRSSTGKRKVKTEDTYTVTNKATTISAGGDFMVNTGMTESGEAVVAAEAGAVTTQGAKITTQGESFLYGSSVNLLAVRNLTDAKKTSSKSSWYSGSSRSTSSSVLSSLMGSALNAGADASLLARDDINIVASSVAANNINLTAGQDGSGSINILGENQVSEVFRFYEKSKFGFSLSGLAAAGMVGSIGKETENRSSTTRDEAWVGSTLDARRNIVATASDQLNVTGSTLNADGAVAASARDITVTAGMSTSTSSQQQGGGFNSLLAARNHQAVQQTTSTTGTGSLISGDTVLLDAANDLGIQGSQVVGTGDVSLLAGGDAVIGTVTENSRTESQSESTKNGVFGHGLSMTLGQQKQRLNALSQQHTEVGSLVGSETGQVTVVAGGDITQRASTVFGMAGLDMTGQNITIEAGESGYQTESHERQRQAGITAGISSPVVTAITSAVKAAERSEEVQNERLQRVLQAKAALETFKVAKDVQAMVENGTNPGIKLSVSAGANSSRSDSESSGNEAIGSTLQSAGTISLKATGDGTKGSGDLAVIGSQVQGGNVSLTAADDLLLQSAQNQSHQDSSNKSSGGSIGVGLALGGTSNGLTLDLSAQMAKGKTDGDSLTYTETVITATNQLALQSDNDTTLRGAQAHGEQVTVNVGGDLNLISQQDKESYDSQSKSGGVGISICVPPVCVGTGGVSGYYSQDKITSDYESVREQTGLYAGEGGFDITVGGNTDLKGAVIASEASAEKNTLSTDTLTYSDIENRLEWDVESAGFSASTDMLSNPMAMGMAALGTVANTLGGGNDGDSQSGTTHAAISAGTIDVRQDEETGKDSMAGLSRDATSANAGSLDSTFDAQAIREQQELVQVFGQVGFELAGDLSTYMKWEEGSLEKIALHGLVGYFQTQFAGGNPVAGMTAAMANEWMTAQIAEYIKAQAPTLSKGAQDVLHVLASGLLGYAINGLDGATTTMSATQNNYLKHDEVVAMGKELAKCNFDQSCIDKVKSAYDAISLRHENEMVACGNDMSCQFSHAAQIEAGMQALNTNGLLGYGGISLKRHFEAGQSGSEALNKLSPEMQPLADVAGFMIANCGGQFTPDCQSKLVASRNTQMKQAAVLMAVAFGPAVIGGAVMSAEAIVGCLSSPLCRLEAADQLAGAAAGMPSGILGLNAGGAVVAGTKLTDVLTDPATAKSTEEMAFLLRKALDNNIHRDDDLFTNVADAMAAAEKAGWKRADGRTWYPPENGVIPGTQEIVELKVGQKLDRYGGTTDRSSFLAPADTPMEQRALPPDTNFDIHDEYLVVKPFKVEQARIMPWFGREGTGLQFETKVGAGMTIRELEKQGYLRKVSP